MYHALIARCAESRDLIDGTLRPGAVAPADAALPFIETVVERVTQRVCESVLVRLDAGFPPAGQTPKGLEARGIGYVARIRNNAAPDRIAQPYLRRPPGRPPRDGRLWCHELSYDANSWDHARRVLLVVERLPMLCVDHFWLLTNLRRHRYRARDRLGQYRMRGKAERHMAELIDALASALSSVRRPKGHYPGRRLGADARA